MLHQCHRAGRVRSPLVPPKKATEADAHGAEPGAILSADGAIQRRFLLCRKRARCALREVAQRQRPDGYADQPQHLDPEVFEHAPNVAVFPFLQSDRQPGIPVSLPQYARLFHLKEVRVGNAKALYQRIRERGISQPRNLHVIDLRQMAFRSRYRSPPTPDRSSRAEVLRWLCPNAPPVQPTAACCSDSNRSSRALFHRKLSLPGRAAYSTSNRPFPPGELTGPALQVGRDRGEPATQDRASLFHRVARVPPESGPPPASASNNRASTRPVPIPLFAISALPIA